MPGGSTAAQILGGQLSTIFTYHAGERLHVVTFAKPSPSVASLALSVHRSGGVLNVVGARDDILPSPEEFNIHEGVRPDMDFKFAYGGDRDGKSQKELGYRQILFKRMLFLWRLSLQLPPQDLLLYVDGEDVVFQRNFSSMLAAWRRVVHGSEVGREPVIFAGCPDCGARFQGHPDIVYPVPGSPRGIKRAEACARWRRAQPHGTLPFLDSGGYLGRAHMVSRVLQDALAMAWAGLDYICMSTLHIAGIRLGPTKLRVDTEASLFYTAVPRGSFVSLQNFTPEVARPLCGPNYFDSRGQPPVYLPTGEIPSVLHFAGGSKWYWLQDCHSAIRKQFRNELSRARSARSFAVRYCYFSDTHCEPCREEEPGCKCATCESTGEAFLLWDVDRMDLKRMPLSSLRGMQQ